MTVITVVGVIVALVGVRASVGMGVRQLAVAVQLAAQMTVGEFYAALLLL